MYCPNQITYTIQPGDTLYRLARTYDTTIRALQDLNPGTSPANLRVGQLFHICPGPRYLTEAKPTPPPAPRPIHPPADSPVPEVPDTTAPAPLPTPEPLPQALPEPEPLPDFDCLTDMFVIAAPSEQLPLPEPETPVLTAPQSMADVPPDPAEPLPEPAGLDDPGEPDNVTLGDQISPAALYLFEDMCTAWYHQVSVFHWFILSVTEDLRDESAVTAELAESPDDIMAIFNHYYGPEVIAQLDAFAAEQIALGQRYTQAMKAGDTPTARQIGDAWDAGATRMAAYLASVNPYYNARTLQTMLDDLQSAIKQDIADRLTGDYASSIADYDRMTLQARKVADYMSQGIMRRFPNAF